LIRIKGYSTRYLLKRSHRIDFNDDHQFLLEDGDSRRGSISFDAEYVDPATYAVSVDVAVQRIWYAHTVDWPVRLQMNGDFWQLAFCTNRWEIIA